VKEARNQSQILNRKSISRKATHRPSCIICKQC